MKVGRRGPVDHLRGRVAQHPFGPDVEELDDTLRVGRDARERGAVENRILQGTRLLQHLLQAPVLRDVHRPNQYAVGVGLDPQLEPALRAIGKYELGLHLL